MSKHAGPGLVALVVLHAGASAQVALGSVAEGKMVRVEAQSGPPLIGSYALIGDGRLGIRSESGRIDTLRFDQVRTLAVRGRSTGAGALVGGGLGVAAGVFMGIVAAAICETDSCDGVRPYLITIPIFGGGGALLGAAVGAAIPKWKRVFP